MPSGPKVPLLLPAADRKGCIFGLARQKNRIGTTGANKECLRSHVCHSRLRLGWQLHVIWDILYFCSLGAQIYYFSTKQMKIISWNFNYISTAERKKMLSRLRLTEDAISAEANRRCYLGRGSQNVLSRPRLTEDTISTEAQRTCRVT